LSPSHIACRGMLEHALLSPSHLRPPPPTSQQSWPTERPPHEHRASEMTLEPIAAASDFEPPSHMRLHSWDRAQTPWRKHRRLHRSDGHIEREPGLSDTSRRHLGALLACS